MNFTKKELHQRALEERATKLEKDVIYHLLSRYDDYTDIRDHIKEIIGHGCQSGIVSSLIYYCDTVSFYYKHSVEINHLLHEYMREIGSFDLKYVFGDKWDETDPLILHTTNQNILAWFGFEETLYKLALEWEIEL